ncbi:MAG: class I SAM-dependent methyltransferase [Nitrospina sp.]|nr:MAG: class I SAM-dependent methyltransferase [Nitrospina sp.]
MAILTDKFLQFLGKLKINTRDFNSLSKKNFNDEAIKNWSESPCGSNYSEKEFMTREYFDEIERHRYFTHPWIVDTINSFNLRGKKVLEIGCGMGTDHLAMARKGGIMHAIDLIPRNLEVTQKRFKIHRYKTRVTIGDAEFLPYASNTMDFIYSFGVLHHSPDTEKTISEVHRVLKPGGRCYITVYNKHSIFFWWTIYFWNFILKGGWKKRTLQQQLSLIEYPNINPNMVTRLYRKKEFKKLFSQFKNATQSIKHLIPADIVYFSSFFRDPFKPTHFLKRLGDRLGWYIAIEATK